MKNNNILVDGKSLTGKRSHDIFGLKIDVIKKLGFKNFSKKRFNRVEDIWRHDPGMVSVKVLKNLSFKYGSSDIKLLSGKDYIMSLNLFIEGHKNKVMKPSKKTFDELFRRYKGQDLNNKRILIIRTGGLGDLITYQSVVKGIKLKYPTCTIDFATSNAFKPIFSMFPDGLIDRTYDVPIQTEILNKYDYHILFMSLIENCNDVIHNTYFELGKKMVNLDYDVTKCIPKLVTNKEIMDDIKQKIIIKPNTILIHMNSTTKLRSMTDEKLSLIISDLVKDGFNIAILDSPKNDEKINKFIIGYGLDTNCVYSIARYSQSVVHAAHLVKSCVGAICIDSAFGPISGALDVPVLTINGPHPSKNVYGGYYPSLTSVDITDVDPKWNKCNKYPCFHNSQESLCPFLTGNFPVGCIDDIPYDTITEKFKRHLTAVREKGI